jgi:hypothetical protein
MYTVDPRYKGVLYKGFPRYKGVRILIPSDPVGDGQTTLANKRRTDYVGQTERPYRAINRPHKGYSILLILRIYNLHSLLTNDIILIVAS